MTAIDPAVTATPSPLEQTVLLAVLRVIPQDRVSWDRSPGHRGVKRPLARRSRLGTAGPAPAVDAALAALVGAGLLLAEAGDPPDSDSGYSPSPAGVAVGAALILRQGAILVDDLVQYDQAPKAGAERYFGNGKPSCHLYTEGPADLFHLFARMIGLSPAWCQHPGTPTMHYDLTPNKRAAAVRLGAVEVDARELGRRIAARREA